MALKNQNKKTDLGMIKVHREVISSIASLAAQEVDGVYGLKPNIMSSMYEAFGFKGSRSGVKVELGEADAKVVLFIIAEYGVNIPEVASAVQDNVRQAIDKMTGLAALEVNVEVVGISPKKKREGA